MSAKHKTGATTVLIALVSAWIGMLLAGSSLGVDFEGQLIDARFLARNNPTFTALGIYAPPPIDPNIVIIGLDRATYESLPPTLMWNPDYAEVIEHVTKAGAKAIGIDILQTVSLESVKPGGDAALAQALSDSPHVVLIYSIRNASDASSSGQGEATYSIFQNMLTDDNEGNNNLLVDPDGIVRRGYLFRGLAESQSGQVTSVPTLAFQLLRHYLGVPLDPAKIIAGRPFQMGRVTIPWDQEFSIPINYVGPGYTFPYVSFVKAKAMAEQGNDQFFKEKFAGKIVLLGEANPMDVKMTPYFGSEHAMTPGVEVHANLLNTILTNRYLSIPKPAQAHLLTVILALLMVAVVSLVPSRMTIPALLGTLLGEVWLSALLFSRAALELPMVEPLSASALTGLGALLLRLLVTDRKATQVRGMFEKYVTPQVVQELMKHPGELVLGGERVEATVVFTCIKGFANIAHELNNPKAVIGFLNQYFEAMAVVIERHQGTLQCYLGDGLMIIFNAPIRQAYHARRACHMALEMLEELEKLNARRQAEGKFTYHMKIGINTGQIVVGNLGAPSRMGYTSIGDTVNLSSRIKDATKALDCQILCSRSTYEAAGDAFEFVDRGGVKVKGVDHPIDVFELVGVKAVAPTPLSASTAVAS
ncbi:MAG: CHASE2 domain-containing protein [Candidatus Xenobia bacterium]